MSKKKTIDLVVKGEVDFNGITIKHIEGGFSEDSKTILAKDIALIHNMEVKAVNQLITNNIEEFEEGIDIIDLKSNKDFEVIANDLGLINSNGQKYCYILSEQGYLALTCLMRTPKAREIRKQFRRDYFRLRKENKKLKKYNRSNNRFTTKCLMNLEGKKDYESEFLFLTNNAVRNEVERIIEEVGVKAGVIAVKSNISENIMSNWRTRKTNLNFEELEGITNTIARFKDFVE